MHTIIFAQSETSEIVGRQAVSMFCKLSFSFVKELPNFKTKTKETFDYNRDRLKPIVYLLDR